MWVRSRSGSVVGGHSRHDAEQGGAAGFPEFVGGAAGLDMPVPQARVAAASVRQHSAAADQGAGGDGVGVRAAIRQAAGVQEPHSHVRHHRRRRRRGQHPGDSPGVVHPRDVQH